MNPHGLMTDWLRRTFPAGPPLPANRPVPPFLLPNHDGWLVSSEELHAQGPYVLAFFHGSWCQDCIERLDALEAGLNRINELAADVVACCPETLEFPRRLRSEKGYRFRVLSDVDSALGIDLGLAFLVCDELCAAMKESGIDLKARQGNSRPMLSTSSTMIVDRNGEIAKTFLEADGRLDVDAILAALRQLKSEPPTRGPDARPA
jgi:peroxiredoxin